MAPCKHTIIFLLMIVWLLERVISCENLSHPKNLSEQNHESHVHDEDFDLFTKLAVINQSKTQVNETENPDSERKTYPTSRSEEIKGGPDPNSTDNDKLLKNSTTNGTESTEDKWDFSKIFEYFLSFIQKLDTEEENETQENSDEIKKDDQPHTFNKNKFSTNKEECRTDSCDSIPRKENYQSVGKDPDTDFDNDDEMNTEKTQNLQENSGKFKQDEGGISEKNAKPLDDNEKYSQSADSNPDVASDKDDKVEGRDRLKDKDNPRGTRKDKKDVSVNGTASKQENEESIPEVGKTENHQHILKTSKQDEGRISEEKFKSISQSEEYSRSVDSNPDVAFDQDDRFERRESLEGEDDPNMTRNDEDISVNNPAFQQEGDDLAPKVDYYSDFVFSDEKNNNKETQETGLDEKSLTGNVVKEHPDASESKFYSSKNPENKDSDEGSDLTGEDESNGSQKDLIKGNNFMPHESELDDKENGFKEQSSDVDEQERMPDRKEISDNNSSSKNDLNSSQENKRSQEQSGVKPKFNPELYSENSSETSAQDKTHSIEIEPKFEGDKKYYEEDYINKDEDEDEDKAEYDDKDEDEYKDDYEEENDDEETYESGTYFDDFQDDGSYYYYDETEYAYQDFFPPQANDNVMGNPQVITDEPHEEKNYTYSNFFKPPEAFNTILEYLYKYSNNPLFISLNQKNSTEAKNRTMKQMNISAT